MTDPRSLLHFAAGGAALVIAANGRGDIVLKLKPGQILHDNDPRYRGRKLEVVRVEGSYAICMCGPRQLKVRLDRIFSDGTPRRSGYSVPAEDGTLS